MEVMFNVSAQDNAGTVVKLGGGEVVAMGGGYWH